MKALTPSSEKAVLADVDYASMFKKQRGNE